MFRERGREEKTKANMITRAVVFTEAKKGIAKQGKQAAF